jgi:hypothetical protein
LRRVRARQQEPGDAAAARAPPRPAGDGAFGVRGAVAVRRIAALLARRGAVPRAMSSATGPSPTRRATPSSRRGSESIASPTRTGISTSSARS